jgi:hypothetical protein
MIEERVRFIAGTDRGLNLDIARDEPSHIHLPRRRRVVQLDDRGNIVRRGTHVRGDEYRRHAQPAPPTTGEA